MKRTHGNRSDKSGNLRNLYTEGLQDLYWAEQHLLKVLPQMARAADSAKLKAAFQHHLTQTEGHVARLEDAFSVSGIRPTVRRCEGIEGLTSEGEGVIRDHDEGSVRDAGLIIAAQKIEHYEIAAYGSLRNVARTMGLGKAAELHQATLEEEAEADRILTTLSDTLNGRAFTESESMSDRVETGISQRSQG